MTADPETAIPKEIREKSSFVFVSPLSGRRDWQHTWKEGQIASWLEKRRAENEWKNVQVVDGSMLIDWLSNFPAVEHWLAAKMGLPTHNIETPEQHWNEIKTIGEPPPLTPGVFLVNRDEACKKLEDVFSGSILQLKIDTRYPEQVPDFVSAYLASLDESTKIDAMSRCLVISGVDAWNAIITIKDSHILIADFDLDESDSVGAKLLHKARREGHAVIFSGMPGGVPHPTRVSIPRAKSYQLKEALEKAGYKEERARTLSQKSNGDLNSLLRCLQNLSTVPEWAQGTDAAELVIAELLGSWDESHEEDKKIVSDLSGKVYGEWISHMREITLRPGTPLVQRNGVWKVVSRYEGWCALGPRIFDDHLDLFKELAVKVLSERDPKFELDEDKRYAASIYGKTMSNSTKLRAGLVESLALMGSHPKALTSCSTGKPESVAILAIRELLADADWQLWASLNSFLPLLAEAAPDEFLDHVERTLNRKPEIFDMIFEQEGDGITGGNYITGLLWALETLAWDESYLVRVTMILGDLADRDPGGRWSNRPQNSLTDIFLPWFFQTCASLTKKKAAVQTLLDEHPDVGWRLLITLLPNSHQSTSGTHKPLWREIIPDDWTGGVTHKAYWEHASVYTELAISIAKVNVSKLIKLIDRLDDLPPPSRSQLLSYLTTDEILSLQSDEKNSLWAELVNFIAKHRRFSDAHWALKSDVIDEIELIANKLAPDNPFYEHQRLFGESDFDLYEERGDWQGQAKILEDRRINAIKDIFSGKDINIIFDFAKSVQSPWRVGVALGVSEYNIDSEILPSCLESEDKAVSQMAGGYIWGRFRSNGWVWVDSIETSSWTNSQIGQFFSYLPFTKEAWVRVFNMLGEDESFYWKKTNANAYDADSSLKEAIDKLIKYGRPHEAVECLERLRYDKIKLESEQIVRVLRAVIESPETANRLDGYHIVELIKVLQDDPETNQDDLFLIEWQFLQLLNPRFQDASPRLLEQRLADEPEFFCEILRLVFRSKNEQKKDQEPDKNKKSIATNAYHLLSEWRTPPGSCKEGEFDEKHFEGWLEKVISSCAKSGHLEVGLLMIGHVLIHSPGDPSGLWVHHAVAKALNDKNAAELRNGYRTALYNSRGVHMVDPEAKPERELAEQYRIKAQQVEELGYHRFATTLRELASSYEHEAEHIVEREEDD